LAGLGEALSAELPEGIVREATPPERLVVVWGEGEHARLLERLHETGHIALVLEPDETRELVAVSGPPSMLLVEAGRLDEHSLEVLAAVRGLSRNVRVCVLAGPGTGPAGLRLALRHGLSELVDPGDAAELEELVHLDGREPGQRVLAVGAHPDDVEIGCAATLLRHRELGHAVTVLTLSRGAVGGPREERRREAVGAAVAMSAELLMGDLQDTRMEDAHEMIGLIEGVVAAVRPTTVYVHSAADNHQDHRAVHEATVIAARRVPQLFCYQSPSSRNGFAPTRFMPVDGTIEGKVEVLSHYRSQSTRHYLEPDLVVASARYWARQLLHTRYAEPFEVLRASDDSLV
jgi:LmbE family N-acetylglucosaminyl deacetylase